MDRVIEIKKDAGGNLIFAIGAANADPLHVDPDDTLAWTSNLGHFCIIFVQDKSPHKNKARIRCDHQGETTQPLKVRFAKQGENHPHFKYFAIVLDAATNTLITEDPEIILDDVGGGNE